MHVRTALASLPQMHQIAFGASCCERMIPNYEAFTLSEGIGDLTFLRNTLNFVWTAVEQGLVDVDKDRVQALIAGCHALLVDEDNHTSLFTGAANNTVSAMIQLLEGLNGEAVEKVVGIAQLMIDTIDEYLHIVNAPGVGYYTLSPDFERWLEQSPLMTYEKEKQQRDIADLQSITRLAPEHLNQLRLSSETLGIQPLKRGLIAWNKNS